MLKKKLSGEDEALAIKLIENRKFFGYIHFFNIGDEFQIVMFTESSIRWYHDTIKRDYVFLDATGSLFAAVQNYKRLLYYTVVMGHPFAGYSPTPACEFISSDHTTAATATFLGQLMKYEKLLYSEKQVVPPKIVVLDFSLAVIGGVLLQFNRRTLKEYLDDCYQTVVLKDESSMPLCIPYVCAAHVLRRCKEFMCRFTGKSKPLKELIMRLMGKLIQCRNISQIEKRAALAAKVFCLRKVSESFLADLRSLEKVINKVDDSSISLIHIESTELETTAMDEITNKNTTEEEMMIHGGSFSVHWRKYLSRISLPAISDETEIGNQYFFPEFFEHLKTWYLPTCALWTKLMVDFKVDEFIIESSKK